MILAKLMENIAIISILKKGKVLTFIYFFWKVNI